MTNHSSQSIISAVLRMHNVEFRKLIAPTPHTEAKCALTLLTGILVDHRQVALTTVAQLLGSNKTDHVKDAYRQWRERNEPAREASWWSVQKWIEAGVLADPPRRP